MSKPTDLLKTQIQHWYPLYKSETFDTHFIDLSEDAVDYILNADLCISKKFAETTRGDKQSNKKRCKSFNSFSTYNASLSSGWHSGGDDSDSSDSEIEKEVKENVDSEEAKSADKSNSAHAPKSEENAQSSKISKSKIKPKSKFDPTIPVSEHFPELCAEIEKVIQKDMKCPIFVKTNWSAPKDAKWIAAGNT